MARKTIEEYEDACTACEHWITIPDAATHIRLRAALAYDKSTEGGGRKKDARGRALLIDFPDLDLRTGDRLEPNPTLMDVGDFDGLPVGSRVLFWRRESETMCRRRNPVFNRDTGVVPSSVFCPDWLHDQALGLQKFYLVTLFHRLVEVNAMGFFGRTVAARFQESTQRLKTLLYPWYKTEEGKHFAPMPNFGAEIFGTSESHVLGAYGEETLGLLNFSPVLLRHFGHALADDTRRQLERMGQGLIGIYRITVTWKEMGEIPADVCQRYCDCAKLVWQARRALGIPFKPKYHRLAHSVKMLWTHGSPYVWGCWRDETENRVLRRVALAAHALVWHQRVLATHRAAFGLRKPSKRLRLGL